MESKTITIAVNRIEDMESIHGATILSNPYTTTITTFEVPRSSTPTVAEPIWYSKLDFDGPIYTNPDSDLDSSDPDTESNCSFYTTCSSPKAFESSSPLSSIFDDDTIFDGFETPTPPSRLSLALSRGRLNDTTSGSDSNTSCFDQSSNPNSPSKQSSYSTSSLISTSSYFRKSRVVKPVLEKSCLQCHLLGLRCSFSSKKQAQNTTAVAKPAICCSRCLRNGEEFCITQQISGEEETAGELQFIAPGVDILVVKSRAEEMVEESFRKERFALPIAPPSARLGLRRFFRRWEEEVVEEDWNLGSLESKEDDY